MVGDCIYNLTENIAALSVWDDCTDRLRVPHPQNLLGNTQSNVVLMYFGLFLFSFDAGHSVEAVDVTGENVLNAVVKFPLLFLVDNVHAKTQQMVWAVFS